MENSLDFWRVFRIIFVTAAFLNGCCGIKGHEMRLINDLLKEYDPDVRPVRNESDVVKVELRMSYRQLQALDEPTQSVTSLVWLTMRWKDISLQWNASDYGGFSTIRLDPSRVWKPDLTLYNSVHENGGGLYNFKSKIITRSDGIMVWMAPAILKSTCPLDISRFPFDTQKCKLKIGSWVHDGIALDLDLYENTNLVTNAYKKNTEWQLHSVNAKKNAVFYSCCPTPYYDITYTICFNRKPLYYIMTLVFPCMVLSLLASISFLFPADSGERVSLVISVLLGLVVFMLIVNNKTPVTSDSTPMITQYFSAIGFMTFFTLLATAFILRMHHAFPSNPVPYYLSRLRDVFACMFCMKKAVRKKPTRLDCGDVLLADVTHLFNLREHAAPTATRKRLTEEKILEELQKLSRRLEDDDFTNEMKEDWQYTARVFDKLFFWVFLLVYISFSVYVLSFFD